jgi:hypothetical protein
VSEVIPFQGKTQLPANLQGKFDGSADDLISGSAGFPVLSIRGSKWRVKLAGEEVPLTNAETGDPVPSLELVIIRAGKELSKNYYAKQYVEGDDSAPDCFSIDGVRPDPQAESPQCDTCAACPHNVWGSKITPQGNKTKACSDSKILAVNFTGALAEATSDDDGLSGPMMLRVPAASLKDLTRFAKGMKQKGFVPQQISIRVGFDMDASYPKLTFKAVRPLEQHEVNVVGELYDSERVADILHAAPVVAEPAKKQPAKQPMRDAVDTEFEAPQAREPAAVPTPKAAAKKAEPKPAPKPEPKVEPEVVEVEGSNLDDDLDAILNELG